MMTHPIYFFENHTARYPIAVRSSFATQSETVRPRCAEVRLP
jgi:hypothetical protein